jgi:flagellar motor switch protein FliN
MENLNFWVKKLDPYFEELDEIPLFRGESFSFEDLANSIKKELNLENLSLSCNVTGWQKQEDFNKILGDNITQLCLTFTPLMGNVYLLMNRDDVKSLTSSLLSRADKNNFSSIVLEEGFYRFLTLFTLDHLKKTATFQGLSPKIVENAEMKSNEAFCLDIIIETKADTAVHALIAITADFRKYWNDFFSSKKSIILSKVKNNVEVPIQIVAGHTFLTKNEWESVSEGDFIVLDRCYIDQDSDTNKVMFTLNENPIFLAKILKNKIHILDYASYHEEDEYMEQKSNKYIDPSENIEENAEEREDPQALLDEEPSSETNVTILSEEISPMKDIPFKLTVEVAKISISLEKLLELQPGNFLKLPVSPENPVNLTVNGKKIGTAEITKLGETFGIRILQIG